MGGFTGYNSGVSSKKISDNIISGNINGDNYVGLGIGFNGNNTAVGNITSVIVEGNVFGTNYIGGIVGYNDYANIKGVIRGGSVVASGASRGRIYGGSYYGTRLNQALSSITVNSSTVTSSDLVSNNGKDITSGDLANQATYTNVGFNFTDETLDYIWYMDGSIIKFREGAS